MCLEDGGYLHVITLGWPPTGRQVAGAALAVLPGVLAHGARHEDRDQCEPPEPGHRVCLEIGHQQTALCYLSLVSLVSNCVS